MRWLCAVLLVWLPACAGPLSGETDGLAGDVAGAQAVLTAPGAHRVPATAVAAAVEARLASVRARLSQDEAAELHELYELSAGTTIWLDGVARPSPTAHTALALLGDAAGDGLDPFAYGTPDLEAQALAVASAEEIQPAAVAAFDVELSLQMLRFLHHLHSGRVDPRALGFRLGFTADAHGHAPELATAVADGRLHEAVDELRPTLPAYAALRQALAEYRVLAAEVPATALPVMSRSTHAGDVYAGVPALARWLAVLGDLPGAPEPFAATENYDGDLVTAVTRFQRRHGLEPDGVLGRDTLAALSVPPAARVRQIELALERLRWLPHLVDGPLLVVNIPMFHVWGWDGLPPSGPPSFDSDVIVGRAVGARTPVFSGSMRYLVFRPYWDVPPSIARGEIVPRARKDPGYLARQRFEVVWGGGERVEATSEALDLLARGTLRVRQRPGPHNALGLVKFMFPNEHNVYLHGTPALELFDRARRDLSRGCVRVADSEGLAAWVLRDQAGWTRDAIRSAMTSGTDSRVVNLARPVQVILTYVTAMVWPDDGTLRFAADIYGHDPVLDRALDAGSRNSR
jgi:murein L,D-transpeptidase YcbB/YkuD